MTLTEISEGLGFPSRTPKSSLHLKPPKGKPGNWILVPKICYDDSVVLLMKVRYLTA